MRGCGTGASTSASIPACTPRGSLQLHLRPMPWVLQRQGGQSLCVCARCVCVHAWGLTQSHGYQPRLQQQLSALLLPPAIAFTLAEALQGVLLLPGLMAQCGKERIFLPSESSHHCRWHGSRARLRARLPSRACLGFRSWQGKEAFCGACTQQSCSGEQQGIVHWGSVKALCKNAEF